MDAVQWNPSPIRSQCKMCMFNVYIFTGLQGMNFFGMYTDTTEAKKTHCWSLAGYLTPEKLGAFCALHAKSTPPYNAIDSPDLWRCDRLEDGHVTGKPVNQHITLVVDRPPLTVWILGEVGYVILCVVIYFWLWRSKLNVTQDYVHAL